MSYGKKSGKMEYFAQVNGVSGGFPRRR